MSGAQPTEVPLAEQICRERRGAPLVFVAIYSGLPNAARRQVLRETWLQLLPPGTRYKSRRAAAGRAELLASFFGGAVWGNFRENANCGDPPG